MVRILSLTAIIGFLVSVVCLGGAAALGGHAVEQGWRPPASWNIHIRDHGSDVRIGPDNESGPETTRTLTWDGSARIELRAPADLHYTQAPGPVRLTVRGPGGIVERVYVDHGRIQLRDGVDNGGRLTIEMSAPNVTSFSVSGSNELTIEDYAQARLDIEASGSSQIRVEGRAQTVTLRQSGSGEAEMGDLQAQDARVDLSGSAQATISPRQSAIINVSGSGEVNLARRPATLHTDISGSGRVNTPDGEDEPSADAGDSTNASTTAAPSPPAPPAPPPPPAAPPARR